MLCFDAVETEFLLTTRDDRPECVRHQAASPELRVDSTSPTFHLRSKWLYRMAPISALDAPSSMIQAHPLPARVEVVAGPSPPGTHRPPPMCGAFHRLRTGETDSMAEDEGGTPPSAMCFHQVNCAVPGGRPGRLSRARTILDD
jgi:hypothetical protein